ncbi:MAG: type II toxin-antitoxin system RelE/ParE family toxin [Candidatus Faecousia sp.]|nr:type II toxin-antitoxin system RelE/ParE family toxin [Candidatus Faecousia sp.]
MDKYEVRLMNQALQDLDEIYSYIARNLQEPGVAAELLDALESEILSLEYLPYRCSERRIGSFANSGYRQLGYRQLIVKNYIVVYRIDETHKQVLIVTVRYARSSF